MRILIAIVFSLMLGTAAMAGEPGNLELTVKILNASSHSFEKPLKTRRGKYTEALVLRLEAPRRQWEALPPSIETFLYIGTHELRPFATELDQERVILTFHDPDWKELRGGEPMVLTTKHGDPIVNPEKYAWHPRFDPGIIGRE